jgi:hypothetical protein
MKGPLMFDRLTSLTAKGIEALIAKFWPAVV